MTIKDLQDAEVLRRRERRLLGMGFDPALACDVARTTLDLYKLGRLIGRGCPPGTAVAILR